MPACRRNVCVAYGANIFCLFSLGVYASRDFWNGRAFVMASEREKIDYLNEIVRTRGYAHGSHRLLANHDLAVLKAVNDVTLANYIPARSLS